MSPQSPTLLLVDDDVDICANLADILGDLGGYRVDVAHDGPTALELVRQRPFDVALLDLKMPGMDGLTLYRELKKLRAGHGGHPRHCLRQRAGQGRGRLPRGVANRQEAGRLRATAG